MSDLTNKLFQEEFDLQLSESVTEEQLIDLLAERILIMLERQPEYIFSMLYRMDVSEQKVSAAMHPNAPLPANVGLAHLIIQRQKQRQQTRQLYREDRDEDTFTW